MLAIYPSYNPGIVHGRTMGTLTVSPLPSPLSLYKSHPIYGVAVPAPEHRWYARGLVFDRDLNQTIEIKRIESNPLTFKTKKQAEKPGLELSKEWIDKRA